MAVCLGQLCANPCWPCLLGIGPLVQPLVGAMVLRFPWFVEKSAPVSGVRSLLDHDVQWRTTVSEGSLQGLWLKVVTPVTSLCPCSKKISAYGAHNQRSHISIESPRDSWRLFGLSQTATAVV